MRVKDTQKRERNSRRRRKSVQINWQMVKKISISCLLMTLLVWGYLQISDPDVFPVNRVSVAGEYSKVNQAELKQIVMPYVLKGFFMFSVKTIQKSVEQIPWVMQSTVYRRWPDEIVIELKQQTPIAIWNDKALINENRELFYPDNVSSIKNLPHLYGPKGLFKDVQKGFDEMSQILGAIHLKIAEMSMDERYSWRVRLNNEIYLIIGHMDYQVTLKNFAAVYKKIIAERANEVNYIDLRYQNGMAIHWKTTTTFV